MPVEGHQAQTMAGGTGRVAAEITKASSMGDVDDLTAAADTQDGHIASEGAAQETKLEIVVARIVSQGAVWVATVQQRIDIVAAAKQ